MTFASNAGRIYSRIEHRADMVIHVVGAIFAINATAWLLAHVSGPSQLVTSVSVYCVGLVAMIFASAAYNLCAARTDEAHSAPDRSFGDFPHDRGDLHALCREQAGRTDGHAILMAIWLVRHGRHRTEGRLPASLRAHQHRASIS